MNAEPEHIPAPDEDDGPLSSREAFEAWHRAHPEDAAWLENQMRRAAAGEMGDLPPEVIEAAKRGIAATENDRAVQSLMFDLKELMAAVEAVVIGTAGREQVPELHRRMDALVDDALGLAEPYRGKFLPTLLSVREQMRKLEW